MTNQEIKDIVDLNNFYKVSTINGETFIGIIDGPFAGYPASKLEVYKKDYIYVTLLNNQQQTIRVHSENVANIELFNN